MRSQASDTFAAIGEGRDNPPFRPGRAWRGCSPWIAVGLSLAIHELLVFAVALIGGASNLFSTEDHVVPSLDTRAPKDGLEVQFVLLDESPPSRRKPLASTGPISTEVPAVGRATLPTAVTPIPSPSTQPPPVMDAAIQQVGHAISARPGQRLGSEPGGGTPGAFFGLATRGRSRVYVIDCSASMGQSGALDAAKRELLRSLGGLSEDVRFQVVVYNRSPRALRIGGAFDLALATDRSKRDAALQLDEVRAAGSTDHLAALHQALALGAEEVFFLTDGGDWSAEQFRKVLQWNRGRCVIHAIELSAAPSQGRRSTLETLARENRGSYRSIVLAN